MPNPKAAIPENIAAVDLGSNSFHMIVARTGSGEPVVVDRLRQMVQLASGLDEQRNLTTEARERALECLRRFGQRVEHMPAEAVRAVGTNTLRSAQNARTFLLEAESALGHSIETISGIEEARLIYLGVTQTLADPGCRHLVVDIGGGSSEVIIGESFRPLRMESLYMGCVSMSRRFFADGVVSGKRWKKAELAALQELEPIQSLFRKLGWDQAVGASGTVRSIEAVVRAAGWCDDGVSHKALRKVRDAVLEAGHVDELELEGLGPERRPIFPAGVVILLAVFEAMKIQRMQAAEGALREGLLYDLMGRFRDEDARLRSVMALAERYHVDRDHAARVERTALDLLEQAAADWKLASPGVRHLLSWAARIHEIGLDIAHAHFHKHGEYIVAQSDLSGFSREDQQDLATLVRSHRRKFPASLFKELPRSSERRLQRAAILLRLAVVLNRSRSPEPQPVPRLEVAKRSVAVEYPEAWLDAHPLTRADLELEQSHLEAAGFDSTFR